MWRSQRTNAIILHTRVPYQNPRSGLENEITFHATLCYLRTVCINFFTLRKNHVNRQMYGQKCQSKWDKVGICHFWTWKQIITERFSRTKCVILGAFDGEIHPYSRLFGFLLCLWLSLYSLWWYWTGFVCWNPQSAFWSLKEFPRFAMENFLLFVFRKWKFLVSWCD